MPSKVIGSLSRTVKIKEKKTILLFNFIAFFSEVINEYREKNKILLFLDPSGKAETFLAFQNTTIIEAKVIYFIILFYNDFLNPSDPNRDFRLGSIW